MQVFDIRTMTSSPYEERDKNVFYKSKEFKTRIIELSAGANMPACEMASYVIFYIIKGEVELIVNQEKTTVKEGQCLITEPAMLSMKTKDGVKVLGIQIDQQ